MIVDAARLDRLRRDEIALMGSRHPVASTMASNLKRWIPDGGRVIVATSGGADSMALLALAIALHDRRTPPVIVPVVGHVDHAVRVESADEAAFVAAVCTRLGLEFAERRLDWSDRDAAVSSEAARQARLAALESLAAASDARAILTAHHADDQAETVLLRLARGTGIAGLSGIPEVRRLDSGRLLLRPLLGIRRETLRGITSEAGLPFVEDPTNHDTTRPRERIRHEVLPDLEAIHPGASERLAALARECASLASAAEPTIAERDPSTGTATLDRSACRALTPDRLAGRIRSMSTDIAGTTVASIPRTVWNTAAALIQDEDSRPRRLALGRSLELLVHRGTASIHAASIHTPGTQPTPIPATEDDP